MAGLFDELQPSGFYYAVWTWDGGLLKKSNNAAGVVPLPNRIPRDTRTHMRTRGNLREAFHFTELGDCVLAGRTIQADLAGLSQFSILLMGAGFGVLSIGLGGGWWLTTRAIRPIEEISSAASRISAGNLSQRIENADENNELGRLAGVLNSTFARLESSFARQKQFTDDASHELRTPLAVLISETQTALARPRSAEEYRETIEACLDTAQQMRRLSESLLALARADSGPELSERTDCDLACLARETVERLDRLAADGHIEIQCLLEPAHVFANEDHLVQVLTNLLANAIHYNKPKGKVILSTRVENGHAILMVRDTGIGISQEDLPHIFERFYRADKSRSRAAGRSGLGLAICKAIVDSCRGSLAVESELGEGTVFTLRLAEYAPPPELRLR
jgi:heavy metal sensor kinase